LFLFLVALACLFPLSLYCLFLAMLHQRRRPTMISGPWDFAGVLIALSGFLIVGGSTLVFALNGVARDWLLRGVSWQTFADTHDREGWVTLLLWGAYILVLVGGAILLFYFRRKTLALYNIDPDELEDVLKGMLERLGLRWKRIGNRWTVEQNDQALAAFDADGSAVMRYVALRWRFMASESVRADLEAELARDLAAYSTPESRTAGWFLTAGGAIFTIMIFLLGTFLMILFRL
jgi:hypothetical protein